MSGPRDPLAWAWTFVGLSDQLPRPRCHRVWAAGSRELIVARDPAGELGAFLNACTHRGTRLCRGAGEGRLSCPYHGWVFETDGRLLGATRRSGFPPFADEDFALERYPLARLPRTNLRLHKRW